MAYVEIETPDGSRRVTLERDRLRIGRLATNDVVLAFPQVSRQHAELRHIKGQWWITDLGSTNGLQLDARRIQDHALRDGDWLMLAPGISIRFHETRTPADRRPRVAKAPLWEESPARAPRESRRQPHAAPPASPASPAQPQPASAPAAPGPPPSALSAPRPASGSGDSAGLGDVLSNVPASDAAAPFALWSASAARPPDPTPTVPVDPSESDV